MIPMTIFDANCLYVLKCLALVFLVAPCVLFAGGMLICLLMWCGLHITRAMHLRRLGLPRCGRCRGVGAAATGPPCSARCMAATHQATFAAAEKNAEKNEVTDGTKL